MIVVAAIALVFFFVGAATAILVLCALSVGRAQDEAGEAWVANEVDPPQPVRTKDFAWPPKWHPPAAEYVAKERVS